MPRARFAFDVIFIPEDELAGIIKELSKHGRQNLKISYHSEVGQECFILENVTNSSVVKDIREILWEAGLIYDAERDPNRLDPVAGRL